jgi:hypothetical protein
MMSMSKPCTSAEVGLLGVINDRSTGSIKKSGRLLNCWITWKAGSRDNSGIIMNLLIASTVSKISSICTQTDAAGVDCHA